MFEMTSSLLQAAPWVTTALVVVLLLAALIQLVRLAPPVRRRGDAIADTDDLSRLLGRTGRALTPMRPVGTGEFDGTRVECVAESGYVETDKRITVIRVEGTQLTVRVTDDA